MQIVSNLLGGMGAVFGLTFVVAVSDIIVSYISPSGKTLTEIVTERVVA
jgi:formate-dependent phosphoribosylglycinamide formyltransferase (GAR transformylase)